jgi:phosphate transport system substrate-binding protein
MKKTALLIAALMSAAISLAAAGVSGAAVGGGAKTTAGTLTGAGATFPYPLISKWIPAYDQASGTQINYSPIGSGGGIAAITARTVDFGASDAPLSPDQFAACKGCVQIPWALSATAVIYNVPGAPQGLKLTPALIAQIYLGFVQKWNAPGIRKLNPGVTLPDLKITPVYRSDSSGTSYNFTDFLTKTSPTWKSKVGTGTSVSWPAGLGARGSSGVTGVVKRTEGGITYADVAYALVNKLEFARVQNAAKKWTLPGIRSITAAATAVGVPTGNGEISIVNPPKTQPLAYPISTFTYALAATSSPKAVELRQFIYWAITAGQKFGPPLLFVPLPKGVLAFNYRQIKKIQAST